MAIINHLVGLGTPTMQAAAICGGSGESVYTAAGTTQATATLIKGGTGYVSICSTSGYGVKLPSCDPCSEIFVWNGGAAVLGVYGQLGESLGAGAANAVFYIGTKKGAHFRKLNSTVWGQNLSS
jgi:hypothetical protein